MTKSIRISCVISRDRQNHRSILELFQRIAQRRSGASACEIPSVAPRPIPFLSHFKEVDPGLWSARITLQYRALGRRRGDLVVWFWIGTHREYEKLIEN
jgi:hypothetical protein